MTFYFVLSKIILLCAATVVSVTSDNDNNVDCGGAGWSYYPLTGFCYGANVELHRSNWDIAENYCKANGGHLATINSLEEYRQIMSYVYTAWDGYYGNWLGYYTEKGTNFDQKNWISVDGTPVELEKFAPWCNEYRWAQQSPRVGGRRCLGFGWDQEKICFYDNDCTVGGRFGDLKVICKRPPKFAAGFHPAPIVAAAPEKYDCGTDGWSYYPPTGFCYGANIAQYRQTGIGAENYCKQNGGHVVTIESLAEYQHLLSYVFLGWDFLFGNWLGYTTDNGSTSDPSKWTSYDGTAVNVSQFVRWCTTEFPRGDGKRCLSIGFRNICLYDVACNANTHKVICKRPLKAKTDDKEAVPIMIEDKKDDEEIPAIVIVDDNKTTKATHTTTSDRKCRI